MSPALWVAAALLLVSATFSGAEAALFTIASQRRYVEYYASLALGQVVLPLPPVLRLEKLRLLEMPALGWTLDGEPPSYHCVVSAGAAGPAAAIVFDSGGKSGCGAQIDAAAWAASAPSTLELPLCW